jgi:hypothetical protein
MFVVVFPLSVESFEYSKGFCAGDIAKRKSEEGITGVDMGKG